MKEIGEVTKHTLLSLVAGVKDKIDETRDKVCVHLSQKLEYIGRDKKMI